MRRPRCRTGTTEMLPAILLSLAVQHLPRPLPPVPSERVALRDTFFAPRTGINRRVTAQAGLDKLTDTCTMRNSGGAAGSEKRKHEGFLYNDSDVYKVLAGVAYSLKAAPDPELEARADAIIVWIAAAQRENG